MSKHFYVEEDTLNQGKFIISLKIVIYRHKFGVYPDFIESFGTPDKIRFGYTTKFWYLFEDENGKVYENLDEKEAENFVVELGKKYDAMIDNCEETGDWTNYPFKTLDLIYHK